MGARAAPVRDLYEKETSVETYPFRARHALRSAPVALPVLGSPFWPFRALAGAGLVEGVGQAGGAGGGGGQDAVADDEGGEEGVGVRRAEWLVGRVVGGDRGGPDHPRGNEREHAVGDGAEE